MKIAVLAWGSLVWDCGGLAITTAVEPNGPRLPVEFSRVSGDGRLTLVIDEASGAPCTTYAAPSAFDELDRALQNLWIREGSEGEPLPGDIRTHGRVGFVDRIESRSSVRAMERHPCAVETIAAWGAEYGWDAVVWTALGSNFSVRTGGPFSVEAAIRYLGARDTATLDKALTYIRRAPDEVRTPVRAAVNMRWPEG
jgi:hypothetical protein